MSDPKSSTESTKKPLPLISIKDFSIPIILSEEVEDQIRYLCTLINKEEWSGILFYDCEGSIKEPSTLKITLKDIFPMDKGSGAYTEYEHDETVVGYLMENPERMKWRRGHIHSHNTMGTFFSGTDIDEISTNSELYNYYLSVITNNSLDFTAKIAFRGRSIYAVESIDEDDKPYKIVLDSDKNTVFTYDCKVVRLRQSLSVTESFMGRVKHLIQKAAAKFTPQKYPAYPYDKNGRPSIPTFRNGIPERDYEGYPPPAKKPIGFQPPEIKMPPLLPPSMQDADEPEVVEYDEQMQNLTINLLLLGVLDENLSTVSQTLIRVKNKLKKRRIEIDSYCNDIVIKYTDVYFQMFEKGKVNDEVFSEDLDYVCQILEEYTVEFPFVSQILRALETFAFQLEQQILSAPRGGYHGDD